MKIKTSNTILYCRKWEQTVEFYKNVLDLEVNFSNEWFVEFILNSQARLSIADQKKSSIKSGCGAGITVCLQVDDVEVMHKRLEKVGVHPTPIRALWESQVFYVRDPEGNRLEFWT